MKHDRLILSLLQQEVLGSLRSLRRGDLAWIVLGGGAVMAWAAANAVMALHTAAPLLRNSRCRDVGRMIPRVGVQPLPQRIASSTLEHPTLRSSIMRRPYVDREDDPASGKRSRDASEDQRLGA